MSLRGDGIQRFVPGNASETALAFRAHAFLRIEQALRRILAFQILRDLAAQETARDRMIGIATQARCAAVLHLHQKGASVGTVQGAYGVQRFHIVIVG